MPTPKLFCYVDETGQDSRAQLFIVSVVLTAAQRDTLRRELARIEKISGKGRVKWVEAKHTARLAYIQDVVSTPAFQGTFKYAAYRHVTQYFGPTVLTVARAVTLAAVPNAKTTVFVDGLPKSMTHRFATQLRHLGIRTEKVRGVRREQADSLMCLADALCGFVRAALAGQQPFTDLLTQATQAGYVEAL
ncbi:MAG: hypothetical protein HY721_00295 [Planctomycetes bacterium]|nr:hypothetical protein [Planctomycetota bacterium]